VVGRGEPPDVIVEQAEALDADLIAMATHGHGRVPRMLYGSVADKVRHCTSIPLLLVKAEHSAEAAPPPDDEG